MSTELGLILSYIFSSITGITAILALIIAIRALRERKKANAFPLVVDLFREYRSYKFKRYIQFIYEDLEKNKECKPEKGIYKLPDNCKKPITIVNHFFDNLGLLVAHDLVDKELIFDFMIEQIKKLWEILGKYIEKQREEKNTSKEYQFYFQYLAKLAEEYPEKKLRKKVRKKLK